MYYIYIYLEPQWAYILEGQTPQNKAFSKQNKCHVGSRYTYKHTCQWLTKEVMEIISDRWFFAAFINFTPKTVRCSEGFGALVLS